MAGDKISSARASLLQFINLLDDRDRLQVIVFNQDLITLTDLSPLGEKRQQVLNRVSGVVENGGTALYDVTIAAYKGLEASGDPRHIRAVVVLSDGVDTESESGLQDVMAEIGSAGQEGGNAIKVFTIAFGKDADKSILQQIAEATGGKQYDSDPSTINKIYQEIATFF
jgi:Ca-activated chloride channel family protein